MLTSSTRRSGPAAANSASICSGVNGPLVPRLTSTTRPSVPSAAMARTRSAASFELPADRGVDGERRTHPVGERLGRPHHDRVADGRGRDVRRARPAGVAAGAGAAWSWCAGIRVPARRPRSWWWRGPPSWSWPRRVRSRRIRGRSPPAATPSPPRRVTPNVAVNTSEPTTRMPSATAGRPAAESTSHRTRVAGRSPHATDADGLFEVPVRQGRQAEHERHLDRHPERALGLLARGVGQEHDDGPVDQVDAVRPLPDPPQRPRSTAGGRSSSAPGRRPRPAPRAWPAGRR